MTCMRKRNSLLWPTVAIPAVAIFIAVWQRRELVALQEEIAATRASLEGPQFPRGKAHGNASAKELPKGRNDASPLTVPFEFTAMLKNKKEPLYQFTVPPSSQPSKWLAMGEVFEGFTVASFDPSTSRLSLRSADGRVVELPLKPDSRPKPGGPMNEISIDVVDDGRVRMGGQYGSADTVVDRARSVTLNGAPLRMIYTMHNSGRKGSGGSEAMRVIREGMKKANIRVKETRLDECAVCTQRSGCAVVSVGR